MSILSSTKSGYKYYKWKELLQNCCEFRLNGKPTNCYITVNEDTSINVDAAEEPIGMKLYTKIAQRGQGMPDEWFKDQLFKVFAYIACPIEKTNYELIIKKPFDDTLRFNCINVNVHIECELPNIEKNFYQTHINGFVNIDSSLRNIYTDKYLYEHRICSYFGKEFMGF